MHSANTDKSVALEAIFSGNLEVAEWFFTDAPLRRYLAYAKTMRHDSRLQALEASEGGLDQALSRWLDSASEYMQNAMEIIF